MVAEQIFYSNGELIKAYSTEEQDWDDKALKELENNYNVFYNPNHVTPIKVEGMGTENPILYFGWEDDGFIIIGNEVVFSFYYLDSLIKQLKLIKQKIDETKKF